MSTEKYTRDWNNLMFCGFSPAVLVVFPVSSLFITQNWLSWFSLSSLTLSHFLPLRSSIHPALKGKDSYQGCLWPFFFAYKLSLNPNFSISGIFLFSPLSSLLPPGSSIFPWCFLTLLTNSKIIGPIHIPLAGYCLPKTQTWLYYSLFKSFWLPYFFKIKLTVKYLV